MTVELEFILLTVSFFAALVQTTTGLGYGMIIAPTLLAFHEPIDAIQITGALTLLVVVALTPFNRRYILGRQLKKLSLGSAAGLIVGSLVLKFVPLSSVRFATLLVLIYSSYSYLKSLLPVKTRYPHTADTQAPAGGLRYGFASGVMGATLAMPGPMALIYLKHQQLAPNHVRATVFALMVGSYAGMLAISYFINGISTATVNGIVIYLPSTFTGLLVGFYLSRRMPAKLFDALTAMLMVAVIAMLAAKTFGLEF